jgi:D-lactate dehydrogenase (cytochrome)
LPDFVLSFKNEVAAKNLRAPVGGHIGDGMSSIALFLKKNIYFGSFAGNFHALILYKDEEELQRANEVMDFMVMRALELDGTCKILHLSAVTSFSFIGLFHG